MRKFPPSRPTLTLVTTSSSAPAANDDAYNPGPLRRLGKNICLIPAAIVVLGIALLMRFGGKPMRY